MANEIMSKGGEWNYYDNGFREAIEPCIQYMKDQGGGIEKIELTPSDREVYDCDFYGLLTKLKINPKLHWIILRLNGMRSPREFTMEQTSFLFIRETEFGILSQMFRTVSKIKV